MEESYDIEIDGNKLLFESLNKLCISKEINGQGQMFNRQADDV